MEIDGLSFYDMVRQRGASSIEVVKVKGHATFESCTASQDSKDEVWNDAVDLHAKSAVIPPMPPPSSAMRE